jgi:hypothetical protein|tara:strand:+ start:397 stop:729 length:333 start_codon:yes stop_codon:yes gene_type:complete
MNKFCVNCGSSITYSANNPPKFCSSCGNSLDGSPQTSEAIEESRTDEVKIPKKMKLEYEVSYSSGPRSMSEIMKEKKTGISPMARKQSDGDSLKRALNECKSARESTEIG